MRKFTQRYIPEGYELSWDDQDLGIQIYYKESPTIGGLCFVGRAINPTWHYRFKNAEQRQAEVTKTFELVHAHAERKATRKAKAKEASANHGVKAGDVFCSSWGYDQTNVDYYQVLSVSNKTAAFCKIAQLSESDGYLQGNCVPAINQFIGKPFNKLIQKSSVDSGAYIKIASYANAYKIEPVAVVSNKPIYESSHWTAYA
jgi:hypothetical protein